MGIVTLAVHNGAVNHVDGYENQMPVSGNQIKAARALIGMEQSELAERAGVSINTVRNMEAAGADEVRVRSDTLFRVQEALKAAGVLFVEENGDGPGVRMRKKRPKEK